MGKKRKFKVIDNAHGAKSKLHGYNPIPGIVVGTTAKADKEGKY